MNRDVTRRMLSHSAIRLTDETFPELRLPAPTPAPATKFEQTSLCNRGRLFTYTFKLPGPQAFFDCTFLVGYLILREESCFPQFHKMVDPFLAQCVAGFRQRLSGRFLVPFYEWSTIDEDICPIGRDVETSWATGIECDVRATVCR